MLMNQMGNKTTLVRWDVHLGKERGLRKRYDRLKLLIKL